jgi:FKBP-type peptidyl-prolyl cis-trans isomerase
MATSTAQRVGIWVIAVAMVVGTIAGFATMIFASQNQQQSQKAYNDYQKLFAEYQKNMARQQEDIKNRAAKLSNKYAELFIAQKSLVKKFDKQDIKKLEVTTIKEGKGKTIQANSTYAAYYIGFNPDGKIFDSSIDGNKLSAPIVAMSGGLIAGWSEGMNGKRIGGIYLLSIPSDKAYGSQGSGKDIPANTPLKFIVMPIEMLKTFEQPKITPQVIEGYNGQQ